MAKQPAWPFADKPDIAVFTTKGVAAGKDPILFVSHDADDGAWQFHGAGESTEQTAAVVALAEVLRLDPSVGELANLPLGWVAYRQSSGVPWQRRAQ